MDDLAHRYDSWKAPQADGQTLLWPAAEQLLADIEENHQRLERADGVRLQGEPLPEVRRRLRAWIGHADDGQPLIATGHQTELYHPGVWVKDVLIDAAASRVGGRAVHFAVDTDAPKHLSIRWPGGALPVTDDSRPVEWSGQLGMPSPAHLDTIEQTSAAASAGWTFKPLLSDFFAFLRPLALEAAHLAPAMTNALHQLDWQLGLRHHVLLLSPVCDSEPYLLFVHHVLSRAGAFAADYNGALGDYRRQQGIRSEGRPMPDLAVTADRCEVPFWLDDLESGERQRAMVRMHADGWTLDSGDGDAFVFQLNALGWESARRLGRWLRERQLRLSPRALMLTSIIRLLTADVFVHGIGGGQYDQVADALISRHFAMDPPRFAVTTATLFFPDAAQQERACVPCLLQEGHRLKHDALGEAKDSLVAAISALPRRSARRAELFYELHRKLAAATVQNPTLIDWEKRLADAERQAIRERIIFDRELFYPLQPAERLQSLIASYRQTLGV